jgi:molecular chaperone DnaK
MGKVIGIDLGTTNSCVCVLESTDARGVPEIVVIPNSEGARTTPSVVAFTEAGERLVGQVAKRQATTNPSRTITAVKRLMGQKIDDEEVLKHMGVATYEIVPDKNNDAWVQIDNRMMSPQEVSSYILLAMKEIAETYLGEEVTEAIVTVPAYFDDAQRQATKDAGRIAGLDVKRIINEPTAAALSYGLNENSAGQIVVYDLGGGTFDVSVLQIADGVFNVVATGGDTHLGGEDFDRLIIDKLAEEFKAKNGIDLRADRMSLQRLREAAERAKHELSSSLETEINVPFIANGPQGPVHLERPFKRSELDILVRPLIDRTLQACKATLRDANMTVKDVEEVVLVGGMTRMPGVQAAVTAFFGKAPAKSVNPDEVVAYGAALQGAALSGAIDEMLLLDVTPLSIGVETGGGVFTKLIPRNTTIPTQKSEIFTTSVDNQSFVPVHVLQGEREMAADNRSLAQFELTGIPPAPRGVPKIQVTFSVDAEGLLSVEAIDLGTNRSQTVAVTPASGLTQEQVDTLIEQGERFKDADQLRRNLAELRNQAETLIYTTEEAISAYGDLLNPERAAQVQVDIDELRAMLASGADLESLREAHAQLENAAFEIAEAMYGGDDTQALAPDAPGR